MAFSASHEGMSICRFHELSHSHVSLLIHMGFTALAIGNRVGHEAEKITYRYAHLFPTVQTEMANKLDVERMEKEDEDLMERTLDAKGRWRKPDGGIPGI